jgi:dienelactone hydrolase
MVAVPAMLGFVFVVGAAPDDNPTPAEVPIDNSHTRPAPPYLHKRVQAQEFGAGAKSYWLFEPDEPRPERAPVVVLNHGWLAVNPGAYGAWVEHLVRQGRIVVMPRYQVDWTTRPIAFLPNSLAALRDAFDVLQTSRQHVRPDRDRFALIGHSAGANLSAQIAAVASDYDLPPPRALVLFMPGEVKPIREPNLARIPASSLLVVVAAEHDVVVGDLRARQIFTAASAIPACRKKYILYRTDRHGFPALVAHHFAPTGLLEQFDTGEGPFRAFQWNEAEINAFDREGFWRVADLTLEAAFTGKTLDEATDSGALFRNLGKWSDGQPVLSPIVSHDLAEIPHVPLAAGLRIIPWLPPEAPAARRALEGDEVEKSAAREVKKQTR